jgi:hypothetical protein
MLRQLRDKLAPNSQPIRGALDAESIRIYIGDEDVSHLFAVTGWERPGSLDIMTWYHSPQRARGWGMAGLAGHLAIRPSTLSADITKRLAQEWLTGARPMGPARLWSHTTPAAGALGMAYWGLMGDSLDRWALTIYAAHEGKVGVVRKGAERDFPWPFTDGFGLELNIPLP